MAHFPGPFDFHIRCRSNCRESLCLDRSTGQLVHAVFKYGGGDVGSRLEFGRKQDGFRERDGSLIADHLDIRLGMGGDGKAAQQQQEQEQYWYSRSHYRGPFLGDK